MVDNNQSYKRAELAFEICLQTFALWWRSELEGRTDKEKQDICIQLEKFQPGFGNALLNEDTTAQRRDISALAKKLRGQELAYLLQKMYLTKSLEIEEDSDDDEEDEVY